MTMDQTGANVYEIIFPVVTAILSITAIGISIWSIVVAKRSHIEAKRATAMETAELAIQRALGRASYYKFEEALEFVGQANAAASRTPQNIQTLIDRTERLVRAMSANYLPTLDFQSSITADTDEGKWWQEANTEKQRIFAALEKICKDYWKN